MPAEQDVVLGPGAGEHPAHDVDAHPLGGLVEVDRVAPALVHRPAVLAEDAGVAEDRLERRLAAEDRRHREHRVEPVPELAREALGDEVGREPLRPVVRRPRGSGASRTARCPRPATGCRRRAIRSTGSPHDGQAIVTASTYGPVRRVALERVPALDRPLVELLAPADDVERAARLAVVDRQRQAPVALLADHPVVHVQEPVELALVAEARDPADLVDDLHDLVAEAGVDLRRRQLVARLVVDRAHRDVPLVDEPEERAASRTASSAGSGGCTARGGRSSPRARGRRRSARRRRGRRGRSASRTRRGTARSRRSARSPAARAPCRAGSPRRRSPARCGRCRCPRPRRPRSRRRPGARTARPRDR